MSKGQRFHPEYAGVVAEGVLHHLGDRCHKMEISGSLRRRTADVGDIEIVCVPKIEIPQTTLPIMGLGPNTGAPVIPLYREVRLLDWLIPRKDKTGATRMGERYMALIDICTDVPVDLFVVLPPAQWGVIMTIRTGSADFSHMLLKLARKKGFHCKDGQLIRERRSGNEIMQTPSEHDFFRALNVAWVKPEDRV